MTLLRQLDELIKRAHKLSDRSRTTVTGDLEDLRNQARYCLEQVGPIGQKALREISQLRFHPPPANLDQDEAELMERLANLLDPLLYPGPFGCRRVFAQ